MQGDRRAAPRTPILTKVILVYGGSAHDGVTTDISINSVFVKASVLPAVGTLLKVDFCGKQLSGPAVRFARVVRHETGGAGLRGVGLVWVAEEEARAETTQNAAPAAPKETEAEATEAVVAASEPVEEEAPNVDPEPLRASAPLGEPVVPPSQPVVAEPEVAPEVEESTDEDIAEPEVADATEPRALEPRSAAMDRWASVYKKGKPLRFAVGDAWCLGKVFEYARDGSLSIYTHEDLPREEDRVCLAAPHVVDRRLDVVRVLGAVHEVRPRDAGQTGGYFRVVLDRLQPL